MAAKHDVKEIPWLESRFENLMLQTKLLPPLKNQRFNFIYSICICSSIAGYAAIGASRKTL
ncbi:MAG: hypothetical protein M3430_19645 [Acidobacteriota bacterium]|nr:hypothetical protein [Acidobacteriota bacterium]